RDDAALMMKSNPAPPPTAAARDTHLQQISAKVRRRVGLLSTLSLNGSTPRKASVLLNWPTGRGTLFCTLACWRLQGTRRLIQTLKSVCRSVWVKRDDRSRRFL